MRDEFSLSQLAVVAVMLAVYAVAALMTSAKRRMVRAVSGTGHQGSGSRHRQSAGDGEQPGIRAIKP